MNGDFSKLLAVVPNYKIYNPFTRRAVSGGRFEQDPFSGQHHPHIAVRQVGKTVLRPVISPLRFPRGIADFTQNYNRPDLMETANYYTHRSASTRNSGTKNRLYGRYSWYDRTSGLTTTTSIPLPRAPFSHSSPRRL